MEYSFLAIFIIVIVAFLLLLEIITASAGVPILAAAAGWALGSIR